MENFQIPIERELYTAALDMMKWPKVLSDASSKAEQAKEVCRPLLVDKLSSLRRETRDNIKTLMTGITELYNMFNLELCDIAAQTCSELRVIVDDINTTITSIIHQETSLGIPIDDTFEDFYPILNHFEIIEQYWSAIYKSVRVSAYYSASVSALNATEMIEEARKCRRLLHHATREVRAYPALVRLGKQKELALADFENLETLLDVLTTPGLKKNHWKDISRFLSARLGDDIHSILDRSVSLQKLLDADVLSHLSEISKIASLARSDYEVESSLEEMKSSSKRTYFQISTVKMTGGLSQSRISKSCYKSMLEQVEGYIFRCQCLFRRPELSGAVVSVLIEWEVSTEKARDVLLAYEVITDRWISMKGYFRYLKELEKDERLVAPEHQIVLEKLNHAEDAMNLLTATFKKPQFSLYTAIVQDTIVEQLLICKSAVEEAFELLSDSLEAKRRDFPRFFLLTDEQVQTILSPLNVEALMNLLPLMYPNLAKLKVEGGEIVAFIGDDGSYLKASKPLAICSQPIESFMIAFESTLKESLYQAVVSCTEAFRQMSTQVWVDSFFPQVLLLALRITHTRDLREVLSFGGACALSDYLNKVEDMHNEFCRISALGEGNLLGKTQTTSVIFYTQHMISEIRHAIESGITTVTELDMTGMIQTFLDEGGIVTRTLGVNIPYGFEFLGGHGSPFISTEIVEKASTVLLSFAFRGSSPLICGTSAVQSNVLDCVCSFIGRLQICVPCFDELDISKMRTLLRASAQIGAVLFLHNSQFLKNAHVHNLLELCSTKIQEALSSGKDHPVVTLPLGPGGSGIDVFVDTGFHLVLGSDKSESLPETVRLRYRPVHVDPIRLQDVAWTFVYANGLHLGELNLRSAVYEAVSTFVLFNELQPSIFTAKGLLEVLRRAILSCEVADDFTRAFCDSCWSSFSFIF
ncbi:hypothetical protein AGDE_14407 [Angomonas deanei]|uniref:Dynein heavy chain, N-terminal region 2, putative n=1 Tax=Angomonas deanei TaxID=59799 RepID=A0A7G2CRH9_9TRYP|nr:hypothetical protein AGDE_14407 [Angomonas deanei]CAD2222115.1 Dynein heavy chain, N-terminal region 2, putative [Angomonas deanei]|eukprot:EPY20914.1 hypothetical protein AGDE_14407 [Angomonas deanei]